MTLRNSDKSDGKPVTGGAIGTQISRYQSYSDAGQLEGYLGSLRGVAEYEKLNRKGGSELDDNGRQDFCYFVRITNTNGAALGQPRLFLLEQTIS